MTVFVVIIIVAIFGGLLVRAARNSQVNRVLLSQYGNRWLELTEETGRAAQLSDLEALKVLAFHREALFQEAAAAGYDLKILEGYFRSKLGHG